MKVWENFKPLSQANLLLVKKRCWLQCEDCKNPWAQIETVHIHMIVKVVDGQQKTFFICDACLECHKSLNDEIQLQQS